MYNDSPWGMGPNGFSYLLTFLHLLHLTAVDGLIFAAVIAVGHLVISLCIICLSYILV